MGIESSQFCGVSFFTLIRLQSKKSSIELFVILKTWIIKDSSNYVVYWSDVVETRRNWLVWLDWIKDHYDIWEKNILLNNQ